MKNLKNTNKVICCALILAMLLPNIAIAGEADRKNETVYVNLDASGSPREKRVVEWLHSNEKSEIKDRTILSDIVNLKSDQQPVKNGEELTWKIEDGDIYYQGNTDKKLPLDVKIRYFLDGTERSAQEIAGKAGKLEIRIAVKNLDVHRVTIGGKQTMMYTPMTVALTTALPDETFKNVTISSGKLISDGNNQLVLMVAMPGLKDSLNLDGYSIEELKKLEFSEEFSIFADVTDFKMGSIYIGATPELLNMDKIKKSKDFEEMKQDLYDLKKVQDDVEFIDPDRDLRSLFTNSENTAGARLLINDIFDFYDMDKALLDILPDYITPDNITLYDRVQADVKDADLGYILDNETFRNIPDRLTDENIEKSKKLVEDYDELQTFDMKKLDRIIDTMDSYDDMYDMIDRTNKVYYKIKKHPKERKTLMQLANYSSEATSLINAISSSGLQGELSDEDIGIMLNAGFAAIRDKKLNELENYSDRLIAQDGTIAEENRDKLCGLVQGVLAAGAIDEPTATALCGAIQSGNVGEPGEENVVRAALENIINGYVEKMVGDNIEATKNELGRLMKRAKRLDSRIRSDMGNDYLSKISKAQDLVDDIMPDLRAIEKEAGHYQDTLDDVMDLVADRREMNYLYKWARKIKSMKKDLDENNENLEILRDMLQEYEDEKVKYFKERFPVLRADFDEARPILKSLSDLLEEPVLNTSLHNSPETVEQLLKMRKDLEDNRNISEILRTAMQEKNVEAAKGIIQTLDRLQEKKAVERYIQKVNDGDELFERKEELVRLSENYSSFAGAAEGTETQLKFIMKTDEIEKPEPEQVVMPPKEEKRGFFQWCISIVKRIRQQ